MAGATVNISFKITAQVKQQALSFDPSFRASDAYINVYRNLAKELKERPSALIDFNGKLFLFCKRERKRESYLIDVHSIKLPGVLAWIVSDSMKYSGYVWPRSKINTSSIQLTRAESDESALLKLQALIDEQGLTLSAAVKKIKT